MTAFRAHDQALGRPLGLSRLGVSLRPLAEVRDAAPSSPKAEGPKVHIGFRLSADVVESLKASGPNYNRRVEEALRAAGFGAAKTTPAKRRP
jgi:BrnA antitoxin of type II toxin-antitoxin system